MEPARVFADPAALAEGAAVEIERIVRRAIDNRGRALVALAGGSTPRGLYGRLGAEPWRSRIDWSCLEIFWGDERCVPPTDSASNYAMAKEALLARVPIPERAVHRIDGERAPKRAAALYEEELRRITNLELPRLDLVLLGMGADGHTASLFPGTAALDEKERLVVATEAPAAPRDRVTLTLPMLNAARAVLFLVQGGDKAPALERVLAGGESPEPLPPAARVRPRRGELLWLADRAATGA